MSISVIDWDCEKVMAILYHVNVNLYIVLDLNINLVYTRLRKYANNIFEHWMSNKYKQNLQKFIWKLFKPKYLPHLERSSYHISDGDDIQYRLPTTFLKKSWPV